MCSMRLKVLIRQETHIRAILLPLWTTPLHPPNLRSKDDLPYTMENLFLRNIRWEWHAKITGKCFD